MYLQFPFRNVKAFYRRVYFVVNCLLVAVWFCKMSPLSSSPSWPLIFFSKSLSTYFERISVDVSSYIKLISSLNTHKLTKSMKSSLCTWHHVRSIHFDDVWVHMVVISIFRSRLISVISVICASLHICLHTNQRLHI